MRSAMKTFSLLLILLATQAISCSSKMPEEKSDRNSKSISAKKGPAFPCDFTSSNIEKASCNISFSSLIVNAEQFDQKRVFTYAYLRKAPSPTPAYTLLLERELRRSPDSASCVLLGNQLSTDDVSLADVKPGRLYSVALAGDFVRSTQYICAGTLKNVDFQEILEEPYDH